MSDHPSLSGARTSISQASKQGSSVSRNGLLIKKNIAPQDLKPSDILVERFVAWKTIVKQIISYFEGIAEIETNTAKELNKLGGVIQVPFRSGNQFLGEGGLQDIYHGIRDETRIIAEHHVNLARTVNGSIIQHLHKVMIEVKAHIKNIQNDTGKLAISVAKERELSAKCIAELTTSIASYKSTPMNVTVRGDPYITNQHVARQLYRQVHEENLLQKSIVIMQHNSALFEEAIVRSIQSAWQTFEEWESRANTSNRDAFHSITEALVRLGPDREWISFSAREDHLLDPDTPLRDPDVINYPSKDDPVVVPVHVGHLERKKRYTRAYHDSYYVLTPAGYLHEYASSDPSTYGGQNVVFSLFLPACTLGPPVPRTNKFYIEETKSGDGTTKVGSLRRSLGHRGHAWTFRSKSKENMMEWWNDIRMLCARYLVASEQMERSGPVAAIVRAAGYASEGDEDEGSSMEGEVAGEEGGGSEADVDEGEVVGQQHPNQSQRAERLNDVAGDDENQIDNQGADEYTHIHGTHGTTHGSTKRRQEKAPEDHAIHELEHTQEGKGSPASGLAPAEAKFTEGV